MTVPTGFSWERLMYEIHSPFGLIRHYYNPMLDLPKLIFQTVTLLAYLHNGFPVAVIFIYSCLLFINWMISSYRYKRERPDPHFVIVRIFYSFDLFSAVFAPLEVMIYAYYSFHFDRDVFATRVATMAPSSFDRTARLFADPTQVSLFRIAFHYLQFTTTSSLFIKCALNVLSIFKWERAIFHLVENARTQPPKRNSNDFGSAERLKLGKLKTFALASRSPACCDGFVTGKCDLTDFSCRNRTASGDRLVQCTSERMTKADYDVLMHTDGIVCEKNLTFNLKDLRPKLATVDVACGGVMYKQCILNSAVGMCFPARMQPVSCQLNKNYQDMRRLQIAKGVGERCDPAVEAWLSCSA